jgi:CheY-like chemotaxis protein
MSGMGATPHPGLGGPPDSTRRGVPYHVGVPNTSPPKVVLLVEDNPAMRSLIRSLLEPLTPVVHECADGARAVVLYDELHPDLVLMDVRMGGMDGLAATRAILRSDPRARIVVVTGYSDDGSREAAMAAGASGFILKDDLLGLPAYVSRVGGETV